MFSIAMPSYKVPKCTVFGCFCPSNFTFTILICKKGARQAQDQHQSEDSGTDAQVIEKNFHTNISGTNPNPDTSVADPDPQ